MTEELIAKLEYAHSVMKDMASRLSKEDRFEFSTKLMTIYMDILKFKERAKQ